VQQRIDPGGAGMDQRRIAGEEGRALAPRLAEGAVQPASGDIVCTWLIGQVRGQPAAVASRRA